MTPLSGELSTYHDRLTLFESGDLNSRRTVVFVGGLGDGLQSVPYLNALSSFLASIGWSLVQVNLSSSYNQFGLSSLDNDVEELGYAFEYLYREKSKTDIVLMGHSTGCQDAIHYLVTKPTSSSSPRPQIKSAILQAPVSDQEFFKSKYPGDHEARIWVKKATDMVLQGNGNEWLPIDASRSLVGEGEQLTPFTAYRYWSLFADGGDDDYFTSSLPEDTLRFRDSTAQLLVLISEKDESYPSYLSTITSQEELLKRWSDAAGGKISNLSAVLPGADHAVSQVDAAQEMFKIIEKFLAE